MLGKIYPPKSYSSRQELVFGDFADRVAFFAFAMVASHDHYAYICHPGPQIVYGLLPSCMHVTKPIADSFLCRVWMPRLVAPCSAKGVKCFIAYLYVYLPVRRLANHMGDICRSYSADRWIFTRVKLRVVCTGFNEPLESILRPLRLPGHIYHR